MDLKKYLIDLRDFGIFLLDVFFKIVDQTKIVSRSNKILFIRLDAIGDFFLWLDSAKALREYYQDKYIVFVGNEIYADVAKKLPFFDEVIPINPIKLRKDIRYRFQVFKIIRSNYYESVIHFPYTRHGYFLDGEAIVHISRSAQKIGSIGEPAKNWRKKISNHFYTKLLSAKPKILMELQRNEEFLHEIGINNYIANVYSFPDEIFKPDSNSEDFQYILFPGASSAKKRWPVEAFAEIARRIYNETGWRGIICGGPAEKDLGEKLFQLANVPLKNYSGKTSLLQLISFTKKAQLIISNDTGIVHIAATVGTPSVCILGGWHFGRFHPYNLNINNKKFFPISVFKKMECFNCNYHCIFKVDENKPVPCIDKVTVESVWERIHLLIHKQNEQIIK